MANKPYRPELTEKEAKFLLQLLREADAKVKRQLLNLEEEQEHAQWRIHELKRKRIFEGYRQLHYPLKKEIGREQALALWLPLVNSQSVVLKYLVAKLSKIEAPERRGRVCFPIAWRELALNKIVQ